MKSRVVLLINMIIKGVSGFILLALLLFGSAGTMNYLNAWMLIIALFVLMLSFSTVLLIKFPETLKGRLKSKEKESTQKGYVAVIGILILVSFIIAGLDYRFSWTKIPFGISITALIVMIAGYILYCVVILQNSYASRVVEVQESQVVISSGLYAIVRHPMYSAFLIVFLTIPIILASYIALIPMILFPIILAFRIRDEELLLISELNGYSEYTQKTKYRIIPFIW